MIIKIILALIIYDAAKLLINLATMYLLKKRPKLMDRLFFPYKKKIPTPEMFVNSSEDKK